MRRGTHTVVAKEMAGRNVDLEYLQDMERDLQSRLQNLIKNKRHYVSTEDLIDKAIKGLTQCVDSLKDAQVHLD